MALRLQLNLNLQRKKRSVLRLGVHACVPSAMAITSVSTPEFVFFGEAGSAAQSRDPPITGVYSWRGWWIFATLLAVNPVVAYSLLDFARS